MDKREKGWCNTETVACFTSAFTEITIVLPFGALRLLLHWLLSKIDVRGHKPQGSWQDKCLVCFVAVYGCRSPQRICWKKSREEVTFGWSWTNCVKWIDIVACDDLIDILVWWLKKTSFYGKTTRNLRVSRLRLENGLKTQSLQKLPYPHLLG